MYPNFNPTHRFTFFDYYLKMWLKPFCCMLHLIRRLKPTAINTLHYNYLFFFFLSILPLASASKINFWVFFIAVGFSQRICINWFPALATFSSNLFIFKVSQELIQFKLTVKYFYTFCQIFLQSTNYFYWIMAPIYWISNQ